MIVTHKTEIDFTNWNGTPRFTVVEGDQFSRNLECTLLTNGRPFIPPEGCGIILRYRKPDYTGGVYDTMPDGSKAWSLEGNVLTLELTPQLFTIPGTAELFVTLMDGKSKLNSFRLELYVQRVPHGLPNSQRYINVDTFIPHPQTASVGQYLQVSGIDRHGRVTVTGADGAGGSGKTAYEYAVDGGYSGTEKEFAEKLALENLVTCDLEGITEDTSAAPVNADTLAGKSYDEIVTALAFKAGDSFTIEELYLNGTLTGNGKTYKTSICLGRPILADIVEVADIAVSIRQNGSYILGGSTGATAAVFETADAVSFSAELGIINITLAVDSKNSNSTNNAPVAFWFPRLTIRFRDSESTGVAEEETESWQ